MIGSGAENFVYKGVTYNRDSGLNELEVRLGNSLEPQIKGMYQNYLTSTNIKDKITISYKRVSKVKINFTDLKNISRMFIK